MGPVPALQKRQLLWMVDYHQLNHNNFITTIYIQPVPLKLYAAISMETTLGTM